MKAEIKNFNSPDVYDLEKFYPSPTDNFGLLLQLMVGPKGEEGSEEFDIMLCTPKWLMINFDQTQVLFGLHYMIMFEYDYQRIYKKLKDFIESIEGNTWNDIALKIGTIGRWEFQDYQEYKD